MIGSFLQQDQNQLYSKQQQQQQNFQNPLMYSARGQFDHLMEEINESDKFLQSHQIKQQMKIALAMNDAHVLNQLLEASENHNSKLRELIEIMKVNHTNEVNKSYQLQLAVENLTSNLNDRQGLVQHLEKSLGDHRQRECGYMERIAELEEKVNLMQQQNQQLNATTVMLMSMQNNQNSNQMSTKQSLAALSSNRFQLAPGMGLDSYVNSNVHSSGMPSVTGIQSHLNSTATTPTGATMIQGMNKLSQDLRQNSNNINYFPTPSNNYNNNGTIQNNLNNSLTPLNQTQIHQQPTNKNSTLRVDISDSQNALSTDPQSQMSAWNKTQVQQINPGSSLQVLSLTADQDQQNNNSKSNFVPNINLTRVPSFVSPTSSMLQQQQQVQYSYPQQQEQKLQNQSTLSNSNILNNSRTIGQNQQQVVPSSSQHPQQNQSQYPQQNTNQLNDMSNQSVNSVAYRKKIESILQRDNEQVSISLTPQPLAINNNQLNQQIQSANQLTLNSQRQNQKSASKQQQLDNKNKQQQQQQSSLSNRCKENSSNSKTPKKQNNIPSNYQSQVCTISLKQEGGDQVSQNANSSNNPTSNSFISNGQQPNQQHTPLRSSKSQNRLGNGVPNQNQNSTNNLYQPNQCSQPIQIQPPQNQQHQTTNTGLTRNQSQLNNILSTSSTNNLNGKEEHSYQRSMSQNMFPLNQLNLSNYENQSKTNSQISSQPIANNFNNINLNHSSQQSNQQHENHQPTISPILSSIQNYQIQAQKELMQQACPSIPLTSTSITPISSQNHHRNNTGHQFQQTTNVSSLNTHKSQRCLQQTLGTVSGNNTPLSSNQSLTPKTQNKSFTKIKGTRQNLSSTLNQDAFLKQPTNINQQQQISSIQLNNNHYNNSGQKSNSLHQNSKYQNNMGILDLTSSTNTQNVHSALPSPQNSNNDCAVSSNGNYQNQQAYSNQIQSSHSQRPNKVSNHPLPNNQYSNTTRSASSDKNLIAQQLLNNVGLQNNLNSNDLLSASQHKQNNITTQQQNSTKHLDGSTHSSQTTPQNSKGNTLNRPKETFFQAAEQRSISSHGQNAMSTTTHRRNLTPNLQLNSQPTSLSTKHGRFTSYTQHVSNAAVQQNSQPIMFQQYNQIQSAATTPTSSTLNLQQQMFWQKDSENILINQCEKLESDPLESSPSIKRKGGSEEEQLNYQSNLIYKGVPHQKPYSNKQLQQPQSYQETIETMQSQQIFCAQSEENALFSNRNYNFSNIIKTISTNSNNKNSSSQQQNDDKEKKSQTNYMSNHKKQSGISTLGYSSSKKKNGISEAYMRNLQNSEKDYQYIDGDNDTKMSMQESMSLMSSCMLVNNEHSLVYEQAAGGAEAQEDGNANHQTDQHQLLTKYSNINLKIKDFSSKKSVLFSKETNSSSSNYIPSKLFEEFFITGPSNGDVQECIRALAQKNYNSKNGVDKQMVTEARVLYHYRNPNSVSTNPNSSYSSQNKIINEFTFPYGCQVKQLRMTNSFSSINEILFANNSPEQGSSSVSCFVLAFRQDNDMGPGPGSNNIGSTQVYQSFPVYYSRVHQLLEKINPSKTLYCVCFKVKDFVESTKLDNTTNANNNGGANLQKSYSTSNIAKTKMKFWQTEKVFCFVTYFPFVKFFLQVITSLLNVIKIKRIKTYNERLDSIPNTLSNIDSDFLTSTFIQISEKLLLELANKDLPDFSSSLSLNIQNEKILSKIPNAQNSYRLETEWGIYKALQQFDINNFLFLFLSLLLEHSLVFVTKNITLLTSTIMLFSNSLVKPLKWINPMIFNLPQKLIPILDSPVPILVGLNKDISYVQREKIDTEFGNCLFIQLGSSFKVLNASIVQDITIEIFNEIKDKIEPHFKKIQSHSQKGAPLQEHEELEIKEDCFALIDTLNTFINDLLNKMPQNAIYSTSQPGLLDYEQITNQTIQSVGKHKTFIKTLFKTQMITYYIEEKYKKQVNQLNNQPQ